MIPPMMDRSDLSVCVVRRNGFGLDEQIWNLIATDANVPSGLAVIAVVQRAIFMSVLKIKIGIEFANRTSFLVTARNNGVG